MSHNQLFDKIFLILVTTYMLSGCVPIIFGGAAASTYAVSKTRTVGEAVDDVKISAAIKADFIKNDANELYKKINIEVVSGRVLYLGKVSSDEEIRKAIDIAWQQQGVKEVVSELKVDEKSNYFDAVQYTKDTFITSQLKAKLFAHRDIKFVNYTIVTYDGVVYIFGLARSTEELEKVAEIAAKIKGVDRVVEHVKIVEVNQNTYPD